MTVRRSQSLKTVDYQPVLAIPYREASSVGSGIALVADAADAIPAATELGAPICETLRYESGRRPGVAT